MNRRLWILYAACALVFLADFVVHRHGHFGFEKWPGFYAFVGLVSTAVLGLASRPLQRLLVRPENAFEDDDAR